MFSQLLCFLIFFTVFSFSNSENILASQLHHDPLSLLLSFNFTNGGNHYFGHDSTRPTGKNIQIAMLDTGIQYRHPVFFHQQQQQQQKSLTKKKKDEFPKKDNCHNFAGTSSNIFDEDDHSQILPCIDRVGHGTFVAGILVGDTRLCSSAPGFTKGPIAPNASLLVAKVFSDTAMSYTSHIVDALNFILTRKTMQNTLWELSSSEKNLLNKDPSFNFLTLLTLSTGSSDYMDEPFNAKIDELLAAGITVVTAAGNNHGIKRFGGEGVLNPADRLGVIAVGGVSHQLKFNPSSDDDSLIELAEATAGGLTNVNHHPHEFRLFKPDVATFSEKIFGAKLSGSCGVSSGTSVAAPIVTGILALAHEKLLRFRNIMPNPGISRILIWKSSWMPKKTGRRKDNKQRISTMESDSELVETFEAKFANSFYGAGSGLLNPEELIRLAVETENFDIAFHPPHLNFYVNDSKNVLSAEFLPLSRLQLPIYPSKNLAMTISVAVGESPAAKLIFSENDVELRTKDSKWIKLNSKIHGFNVKVKPMKENSKHASNTNQKTVIDIFPYVGAFQIIFEAVDCQSEEFFQMRKELFDDDNENESVTFGKIHMALKIPDSNEIKNIEYSFSISHKVSPPPREKRILWISHRNLHWPKSFVASDDAHPSVMFSSEHNNHKTNNNLHHADFFESSSDDPLGGSPTSILLFKLITCENNYFVDVLNNDADEKQNSMLQNATLLRQRFSAIILYDPEDYFTPKEYEVMFDAMTPSNRDDEDSPAVNLVVVSDWYSHDLMKPHHFEKNNPDRNNIAKKTFTKNGQKTLEPERLVMAGSNVPSLNFFLDPIFGVKLIANSVFSFELHEEVAVDNGKECLDEMNKGKLLGYSKDKKFHAIYPTSSMSAVVPSSHVEKERRIEFYGPRSVNEEDCPFIATKWSSSLNKNHQRILNEEILPEKFKNVFPMMALVENNNNDDNTFSKNRNRAAIVSDSSCFTFQHKSNGINPCVSLFKALVDFAVSGSKNEDFFNARHKIKNELVDEFAKDVNERKLTREILDDADMRRRFAEEDSLANSSKILKEFFLD